MASSAFKSVDEYIASQPEAVRPILERVRRAIRDTVPAAGEVISYNLPTYKLGGEPVLYFAAWKRHYSLYPASGRLVAEFKDQLAPYEIGKGTIRFPLSQPVPESLIARIARFRAKEVAAREKAEPASPAKVARPPARRPRKSGPNRTP
jgi:uncharacterized protein YdhG (YjbR/CyaY superfamily)